MDKSRFHSTLSEYVESSSNISLSNASKLLNQQRHTFSFGCINGQKPPITNLSEIRF